MRLLLAPLVLLFITTGNSLAQSTIESKVEKLEETVRLLERRVATLEEQCRQRTSSAPVAADKMAWRKLKMGMSESDVEYILGSPSRVDAFGPFTVWHYGNMSRGQVSFDGDSRTVTEWHEPR